MQGIHIGGEIRLSVNDDPNRIIAFDPNDLGLAERTYKMLSEYEALAETYRAKSKELVDTGADFSAQVAFIKTVCDDMKGRIDTIFGVGTSLAAFGDSVSFSMFEQFFDGVIPFIEEARRNKTAKYTVQEGALR